MAQRLVAGVEQHHPDLAGIDPAEAGAERALGELPDLSGDLDAARTGADGTVVPLPGVAPVAMQQGRYAGRAIRERLAGRTPKPFRYRDKGNLATIGRSKAVADVKGLHVAGFFAWVLWLVVHLFYLIGFQNRLLVILRWTISFMTRGRGARLILERDEPDRATERPPAETVRPPRSETSERRSDPERTSTTARAG